MRVLVALDFQPAKARLFTFGAGTASASSPTQGTICSPCSQTASAILSQRRARPARAPTPQAPPLGAHVPHRARLTVATLPVSSTAEPPQTNSHGAGAALRESHVAARAARRLATPAARNRLAGAARGGSGIGPSAPKLGVLHRHPRLQQLGVAPRPHEFASLCQLAADPFSCARMGPARLAPHRMHHLQLFDLVCRRRAPPPSPDVSVAASVALTVPRDLRCRPARQILQDELQVMSSPR